MKHKSMSILICLLSVFSAALTSQTSVDWSQTDNRGLQTKQSEKREPRVALVIGNGSYENSPLANPVNDAREMTRALRELGFEVIYGENLSQNDMKRDIRLFGDRLHDGGVGLFYYAGHGVQINGRNYLIPVSATITKEVEVEYESVDLGFVLVQMEDAHNRVNIVILDACRNNPFARMFRSSKQGLASIDAPSGTLLAYATAPGSVASDGSGKNGLYTQELLKYMRVPDVGIEQVFKQVRIAVRKHTNGTQTPWESSSLVGEFYFSAAKTDTSSTARSVSSMVLPVSTESNVNEGDALADQKKWSEAEWAYRQALASMSDNAWYRFKLYTVLYLQDKFDQASAEMQEIIKRNKWGEIEAKTQRLVEQKSLGALGHWQHATALIMNGKTTEAEAAYRKAISLEPNFANYHEDLARFLSYHNNAAEAEVEYRKAISLDPDNKNRYWSLGHFFVRAKLYKEAEIEFRKAISLEPDNGVGHSYLAIALSNQDKKTEAEAEYRKAISLEPNFAELHVYLAQFLKEQKRYTEAEAEYREAMRFAGNVRRRIYQDELDRMLKDKK